MTPLELEHLLVAPDDGPAVVRLVGDGAVAVANAWARAVELPVSVDLAAELPGPGVIWLHDAPGARSLGDAWIASSALLRRPFAFLLTGRARDAGHPGLGTTHAVAGTPEPPVGDSAVWIPTSDDPLLFLDLEAAARNGDMRRGLALLELLDARDPDRAAAWRWIELARLAGAGRHEEVFERAFDFADDGHRGSLFAELAFGRARDHALETAADLATEALADPRLPERVQQDLRYLLRLLEDGFGSPDVRPGSPFRVSTALALWSRRHPACAEELALREDPRGRQLARALVGEEDPAVWLAIGALHDAARAIGNRDGPSTATLLYEDNGGDRAWFASVDVLLDAGDLVGARDVLAARRDHFGSRQTFGGVVWTLAWGRVSAGLGDAAETTWARARLARIGPRHLPTVRARRAIPRATEGPDPWCVGHWLEVLSTFLPEEVDAIEARAALLPADRIALGPYALEAEVARGGMGTIWRARHVLTDSPVAIKVMRPLDEAGWSAFRHEVDLASRFEHPCIASVLDRLEGERITDLVTQGTIAAGRPILVMELVEHGSLADLQGMLPWAELRDILVALLDALAYVHAHGVVHRDLKPENVLLTADHRLRLCDFGIAAFEDRIAGTPSFMAPEQFQRADVGPRADLYSLGCTAWALATGLPPYLGTPRDLARAHQTAPLPSFEPYHPVPDTFLPWLQRLLAKSPSDRYTSAAAAAEDLLLLVLQPEAVTPRLPSPSAPPRREPTYNLPTLLDLPPEPQDPSGLTATLRTLHDVFVHRGTFRPRVPTRNLLDTGDPPLQWQEEAQEALWTRLMRVAGGRQQRIALLAAPSQGRKTLLRWLRRKGRMAGLAVYDTPTPRRISVVDATGTTAADWADHVHQPWLLVWREPGPPGVRALQMNRLTPLQTWFLLDRRVVLTSRAAALAATRSLAYPSLGLTLLSAWLDDPGTRLTPNGLAPMRTPPATIEAGRAWWRDRWPTWDATVRHLATTLAVHAPWFPEQVVAEGERAHLPDIAFALNGAWTLTPDLRANLLADLSPDERRHLHLEAASAHPPGPRRLAHELEGDPRKGRVVALAEALTSHRSRSEDSNWLALFRRYRARLLVRHPLVDALHIVTTTPSDQLVDQLREPGVHGALALIRWVSEDRALPAGLRGLHERRLLERMAAGPLDGAHANVAKALTLLDAAAGHPDPCRWVDRALEAGSTPLGRDILLWTALRTRRSTDLSVVERLTTTTIRWRMASDVGAELQVLGDHAAALVAFDATRGHPNNVLDYNRALSALSTGDAELTRRICHAVAPTIHMRGHRRISHGLLQMTLVAEIDSANETWEQTLERCDLVRDPMLAEVMERVLAERPPSTRRDRLLALLNRSRTT